MAESGHSPGPWEWYGPTRGECITFTHEAHVGPGEGNDICGPIACVGGDDDEQAVANAKIIAAVPQMARILRELADFKDADHVCRLANEAKNLLADLPAEQPTEADV